MRLFLELLDQHSFNVRVTGPASKTVRIYHAARNLGYINGTVIHRGALLGYRFQEPGAGSDSCPRGQESTVAEDFCAKYSCTPAVVDVHEGRGSNAGRYFLLLRDPTVGLRVLQDIVNEPVIRPGPDRSVARVRPGRAKGAQ